MADRKREKRELEKVLDREKAGIFYDSLRLLIERSKPEHTYAQSKEVMCFMDMATVKIANQNPYMKPMNGGELREWLLG